MKPASRRLPLHRLPAEGDRPVIWAVGVTRLSRLLADVVPEFDALAHVELIQLGFEEAAEHIRHRLLEEPCDVILAAGSNGAYLNNRVPRPVVLLRANGFDLMQALARARRVSTRIGVITHQADIPEFTAFKSGFGLDIEQRSFATEEEARYAVTELSTQGIEVVVGTGLATELAEQAGMKGILIYSADTVRGALDHALAIARASRPATTQNTYPLSTGRNPLKAADSLLGNTESMQKLREQIRLYAPLEQTVLVEGETGTGKELVARALHLQSARAQQPFVAVNCGALNESLLEAELFGYEEGAFTGARRGGRQGLVESAHNGTLFLDEIGEMPLPLQTRLLRVLEQREVLRVGASRPVPINIRVVAATHRSLRLLAQQERFRPDLLYRLDILRLRIPPLRERTADIPLLAAHFLTAAGSRTKTLAAALMAPLSRHPWPGNVRELRNMMERFAAQALVSPRSALGLAELHEWAPELFETPATPGPEHSELNANAIQTALKDTRGHKGRAAAALGISRSTLWRKTRASPI